MSSRRVGGNPAHRKRKQNEPKGYHRENIGYINSLVRKGTFVHNDFPP